MTPTPYVTAEVLDPTTTYSHRICLPDDITLTVSVVVPDRSAWADVGELSEVVAMGAAGLRTQVLRSLSHKKEDPF